jgi:hypothetical protein
MTQQTSRVIYLPPGVAPAAAPVGPVSLPGIPFDRNFFEKILPQSIQAFCQQVVCELPVVEILTVDGTTHYVKGISGVSDAWVALHTTEPEHEHAIQTFIPYQTIYRVEVHPAEDDRRRRLGFLPAPVMPVATEPAKAAPAAKKRSPAKK